MPSGTTNPVSSPNRPAQLDPPKAQRNYPKDSPEEVVRLFLEATDWEQKLAYVRHPERVKALMEQYYRTNPEGRATFLELYVIPQKDDIEAAGWVSVAESTAKVKNELGQETRRGVVFYLKKSAGGYKIDWEAFVGHSNMTWEAFLAQRPTSPVAMRVRARLSNYYNFEFRDDKKYLSIDLDAQSRHLRLHGFVPRNSSDGTMLYETLRDGQFHFLIMELRYLPESTRIDNLVLIERLVTKGWVEDSP